MFSLLRNNDVKKNYLPYRFRGYHLFICRESFDEGFLEKCCLEPKKSENGFTPVNSSRCAVIYRFEYEQEIYFHKTYLPRTWMEGIQSIFLGSRAWRAFRGGMILRANGFFAPQIVVVGRRGKHSLTVSKMVPNPLALLQYFQDIYVLPLTEEKILHRRKTICELGQTVGKLHSCRISHGDLRWGNIIIDASDFNNFRYVLLDNERTAQFRRLPGRERLKNLVQLNMVPKVPVSRTDKLRFFNSYLKENPELITYKNKLLRRVVEKTRRRMALKLKKI